MTTNLIIKTSSLGDVIHTLPALTDAMRVYPDIQFDWVVEENFAEIPKWHPAVKNAIPVAWRRWRKHLFALRTYKEVKDFYRQLRSTPYDKVIDFQGLVKSALITYCTAAPRYGLDWDSARESLASLAYQHKCTVNFQQHAVTRMRQLMAAALGYPVPTTPPDYGIQLPSITLPPLEKGGLPSSPPFSKGGAGGDFLLFLHGTTWETKLWPETYWIKLAKIATEAGYTVLVPWSNDVEKQRADRIAAVSPLVTILPRLNLSQMAAVLNQAKAIVAVDTGLGHLAAALGIPTVSLYGPTNPALTGTMGNNQQHFSAQFPPCAPCLQAKCTYTGKTAVFPACFGENSPEKVWATLIKP